MNNIRRKAIENIIKRLESILDEEREAFDNMPENLHESMNGLESQDAQANLEAAIDALEEAISCLEEIV